jgi:ribosomal protein L15E
MGAPNLIIELRQKGYSIRADGGYLDISPSDLPPDLVQQLKQSKSEILAELQKEEKVEWRRQKVIAMLKAEPDTPRAIYVDADSDPHNVILTIAVRECRQTCEMLVDRRKYDSFVLLKLMEKHSKTMH